MRLPRLLPRAAALTVVALLCATVAPTSADDVAATLAQGSGVDHAQVGRPVPGSTPVDGLAGPVDPAVGGTSDQAGASSPETKREVRAAVLDLTGPVPAGAAGGPGGSSRPGADGAGDGAPPDVPTPDVAPAPAPEPADPDGAPAGSPVTPAPGPVTPSTPPVTPDDELSSPAMAELFIDAGADADSTHEGVPWLADRYADGGSVSERGEVAGTASSAVYRSIRTGMSAYRIPVTDGTYDVTLHMAETWFDAVGERRFDVAVGGEPFLTDLDVLAAAGGKFRALDRTTRTTVVGGTLVIEFTARTNLPRVSAIVVLPVLDGLGHEVEAPPEPEPEPDPESTPTPSPTPAPPAPGPTWDAPTLVNPLVWTPSSTNRLLRAPANRDVLIRWPSHDLDIVGGIEINGGRNIVSTGGTIRFTKRHFPAGADQAANNRCLHITGNATSQAPRTIHVEALHCAGPFVWEGINIDSKAEKGTLTVQLRDITIDGVNVELPGGTGKHYGGDALQTWNGPHRLRIDGLTATDLRYQGLFLQPHQFGTGTLGQWQLENIHLTGHRDGHGYLLWLAGTRDAEYAVPITTRGLRITRAPGKDSTQTVWELAKSWPDITID